MSTTGYICDVKRFAIHDGPGIRTTIFLKGCPLRCLWCHNPESIRREPELALLTRKCVLCGDCAKICDCHAIVDGEHRLDRARCTGCGKCVSACLYDALEWYGRPMTVEEACAAILEDETFYRHSGGGATLSGGEPLLQVDFCRELFGKLKEAGIHTALDTCGLAPWSSFETILPVTDLFLYDFKHADPEQHQKLTGSRNERILENLERLSQTGKPIEIRMIQVPGLNMDEAALRGAGAFLGKLPNLTVVRLLAYHSLAHGKYQAVGREDTLPDVESPDEEALEQSAEVLRGYGLNVVNTLKK